MLINTSPLSFVFDELGNFVFDFKCSIIVLVYMFLINIYIYINYFKGFDNDRFFRPKHIHHIHRFSEAIRNLN